MTTALAPIPGRPVVTPLRPDRLLGAGFALASSAHGISIMGGRLALYGSGSRLTSLITRL